MCGRTATFGHSSDGYAKSRELFEEYAKRENVSLADAIEILRQLHEKQPFLFFNGNTFAQLAVQLAHAFGDTSRASRAVLMDTAALHVARCKVLSKEELERYFGDDPL